MRRERIASVVTALALVLAAVGGGLAPVGTAQAQSDGYNSEICTLADLVGANGLDVAYDCLRNDKDSGDYENITATNGYSTALTLKDDANSYTTTFQNFQENSRTVAYQKGKIAVVRALENQSGPAVMKNEANKSVRDFYSRQQVELLQNWNNKVLQTSYLRNTTTNVTPDFRPSTGLTAETDWYYQNRTYAVHNATLVNGTTTEVLVPIVSEIIADSPFGIAPDTDAEGEVQTARIQPYTYSVDATDPATSDATEFLDAAEYADAYSDIENQSAQVTANMDEYADGVSSQYQAGDLNASTLYENDPTLLFSEASTQLNSTGYYGYASVQLAAIGAAGDVNQSHVLSINGGEYVGTLFYTGDDLDTLATGETYNFSAYNGTFYLAASNTPTNETGIVNLNQKGSSFTIENATNTQTGEAVQNTTINRYVYKNADANNLKQEIQRLEELREFYENQSAGGGGGFDGEPSTYVAVGLALVLLGALVYGRS